MNNKLGLVKRFNKKEAALAAKISNDIAEGIDGGETRNCLRMAVAYYADLACVNLQRAVAAEDHLRYLRFSRAFRQVAMARNRKRRNKK